jgi:hypothetical protein
VIVGLESLSAAVVLWRELGERDFLRGDMGVQIGLGGLDRFMAEPHCDDEVAACLGIATVLDHFLDRLDLGLFYLDLVLGRVDGIPGMRI